MADEPLTLREIFDLFRSFHARQVKPFEKMPEALEGAIQVIEHDLPAAQRDLETVQAQLIGFQAELPDVHAALMAAKARVAEIERQTGQQIEEAESHARERRAALHREEAALMAEVKARGEALEDKHDARRITLTEEITALEAKKAALDQAIAAVRAKF